MWGEGCEGEDVVASGSSVASFLSFSLRRGGFLVWVWRREKQNAEPLWLQVQEESRSREQMRESYHIPCICC